MSADDLVRWGLHLLQAPDQHHACSCSAAADTASSSSSTENDEALAIRLQEQLYLEESIAKDNSKANQDPKIGDYFDSYCQDHQQDQGCSASAASSDNICDDCAAEEATDQEEHCCGAEEEEEGMTDRQMGNSSSKSSMFDYDNYNNTSNSNNSNNSNENDEAIAVVLAEELAQLDGEVGRRLTHMESIPHVPKINGEIPSADAATLDHQRLIERLHVYGLTEHKIPGDGNCQFRALSDQFYRTPDHHMFVRKEIIKQLKQDPDPYEGYVPMKFGDYLKKMAKNGEWGDHVTLQAAADAYGMKICLITSFRDTCIIDIVPKQPKSERVIFLSFWAEVHYNSVYPEGEVPVSYHLKKKRHWFSIFG